MRHLYLSAALLAVLALAPMAHAEEAKPDDRVAFELSAEDWVTTKTARVTVNVEAAVSGANAGSTRADMMKAVNGLATGEWRLTNFNRSQDQTGLERWSANFETRLPETTLGGLNDSAKKASKAGMQIAVGDIDFSPTLDEVETVRASLRTQLYKKAADQLTALNAAIPGRNYRIAAIDFNGGGGMIAAMPRMMKAQATMAMAPGAEMADSSAERSEKIRQNAHVIYAALPTVTEIKH